MGCPGLGRAPPGKTPLTGTSSPPTGSASWRELGYRDPPRPGGAVPPGRPPSPTGRRPRPHPAGHRARPGTPPTSAASRTAAWPRRNLVADAAVRSRAGRGPDRPRRQRLRGSHRGGIPEHIRALTSPQVLRVETDLVGRLAHRAQLVPDPTPPAGARGRVAGDEQLDATQQQAVDALTGGAQLVVVEGAAGAGKTTVLAGTRRALETRVGIWWWSPRRVRRRRSPPARLARTRSLPPGWRTSTAFGGTPSEPGPVSQPVKPTPPPGACSKVRVGRRGCG